MIGVIHLLGGRAIFVKLLDPLVESDLQFLDGFVIVAPPP